MRLQKVLLVALLAAVVFAPAAPAFAQNTPFLGAWNITGDPPNTGNIYWLEVKDEGGTLSALFLNRGGSPVPAKDVKIANGELTFTLAGDRSQSGRQPAGGRRQADRHGRRPGGQGHRRAAAKVGRLRRQRRAHLRQAGRALRRHARSTRGTCRPRTSRWAGRSRTAR